jgi:hypothetical protein
MVKEANPDKSGFFFANNFSASDVGGEPGATAFIKIFTGCAKIIRNRWEKISKIRIKKKDIRLTLEQRHISYFLGSINFNYCI